MKTEKLIIIKEVNLNNNCPECYNTNGLQLTFKQKYIETNLYKSITNETTQEIECKMCDSAIYPVMWTDDIERVFEYQQKSVYSKKPFYNIKKESMVSYYTFCNNNNYWNYIDSNLQMRSNSICYILKFF